MHPAEVRMRRGHGSATLQALCGPTAAIVTVAALYYCHGCKRCVLPSLYICWLMTPRATCSPLCSGGSNFQIKLHPLSVRRWSTHSCLAARRRTFCFYESCGRAAHPLEPRNHPSPQIGRYPRTVLIPHRPLNANDKETQRQVPRPRSVLNGESNTTLSQSCSSSIHP
ncbi:hypothetical protein FB451DRAFT_628709 [Mycena latifolia]|nr:hypothetical protein FB451DRAFT_628709 [Mycena latifolia]